MSINKVIFVTGTSRSGSTLLDRMLGNAYNGLSVGEVFALFRPYSSHHLLSKTKGCQYNNQESKFWSFIKQEGERKVYQQLFDKLEHIDFIVDSSKDPLWVKDQIKYSKNANYEIIPIIIFKTPVEFAYSLHKRGEIENWKKNWVNTHKRLFYIFDNFLTVKYQDLVKNPRAKLRSVCNKIGIEYFDGKEEFWYNTSEHFLFGSGGVRESNKLIPYDKQYENDKLKYVSNYVKNTSDSIIPKVLNVLEAYEVDSQQKNDSSYYKMKEEIKEYKTINLIMGRLTQTSYYSFNKLMRKNIDIMRRFFK